MKIVAAPSQILKSPKAWVDATAGPSAANLAVDLALVLAVDCSSSVDEADFRMQMDGIAAALRDPSVDAAIASGWRRQIALSLVQWSDRNTQVTALRWRILANRLHLEMTAIEVETAERHWQPGGTGLAAAMDYCTALQLVLPIAAERRVIDVSGDGMDNDGGGTIAARDRAIALGITINGLPIINGSSYIFGYYRDEVIGGPGSFLEPADDMRSFRDAILRKLLREIGRPVS
jgi:hypothetical protein